MRGHVNQHTFWIKTQRHTRRKLHHGSISFLTLPKRTSRTVARLCFATGAAQGCGQAATPQAPRASICLQHAAKNTTVGCRSQTRQSAIDIAEGCRFGRTGLQPIFMHTTDCAQQRNTTDIHVEFPFSTYHVFTVAASMSVEVLAPARLLGVAEAEIHTR